MITENDHERTKKLDIRLGITHKSGQRRPPAWGVTALDLSDDGQPLVFYRGGYGGFRGVRPCP
jgi:hypothetical protein